MIKVTWDANECSHAGLCVQSLPKVFRVEGGKFVIDTGAASEEQIRASVRKCPSGALKVEQPGIKEGT
jgi:uncharacterized Fe-S cluster protein YjdI